MSDLRELLNYLVDDMPCVHTHTFNGNRDLQDFTERDFDRRLAVMQVDVLISIVEQLEKLNAVDTGTRVN